MNETTGGRRRQGWRRAWPRRAGLPAVAAGLALLTAACGGSLSSSGSRSSSGSPSSTGSGGALSAYISHELAFARCVRAHGVPNFPDPDRSGTFPKRAVPGVSVSRIRAAQAPCLNLLPAGRPPVTAPEQQDYLRAAACMRSHGITNFPDPAFSGGGVSFPIPSSIDTRSERFAQARQTCARLIPAGLPYSGSGG